MRYNKIRKMDISNGPGVRVSIFMQGCTFNCKGCFNPETHDFKGGLEFNDDVIENILNMCDYSHIRGLSILGGEPLHLINIAGTTKLCKKFKDRFPDKTIWVWSGFLYDHLKGKEIFNYIDVLVDGQYNADLYDPRLKWKGSSNQRVIDIKATLEKDKIVLFEEVNV